MSTDVDVAFVKQFESEVKEAYQRMGSKIRNTVRTKNGIRGSSTTFQKVGKGVAGTKTRHGLVPVMNLDHSNVECILADYYAGDWADKFDELKTNIDERQVITNAGAYALGRKTDEIIIEKMAGTSIYVGDYSTGITLALLSEAIELLNDADVPDDGNRFGALSTHGWEEFMNIPEASSADYVGDQYPWLKGQENRMWRGIVWYRHSGLPLADTDNRDCYLYHRTALAHASGQDVTSDVTWHGDRAAHFINNMMSQGAALIDETGVVEIRVDDDTALS